VADIFPREKRSEIMSKIRSRGTKGEELVASILDALGVGYVRYAKVLGREVDFLIPDKNIVIEYRSCFFHGCPLHFRAPEGNREYWEAKVRRNRERDRRLERELRRGGYRLIIFWSHDDRVLRVLKSLLDGAGVRGWPSGS